MTIRVTAGVYVGSGTVVCSDGASNFQPGFVLTERQGFVGSSGGAYFMDGITPTGTVGLTASTADQTTGTWITMNATGFTVASTNVVGTAGVTYQFLAVQVDSLFCTMFEVTGNGSGTSQIITFGFAPKMGFVFRPAGPEHAWKGGDLGTLGSGVVGGVPVGVGTGVQFGPTSMTLFGAYNATGETYRGIVFAEVTDLISQQHMVGNGTVRDIIIDSSIIATSVTPYMAFSVFVAGGYASNARPWAVQGGAPNNENWQISGMGTSGFSTLKPGTLTIGNADGNRSGNQYLIGVFARGAAAASSTGGSVTHSPFRSRQ